jgi:tRNA threonylcarbamoyladenosine biosynthesis protein TsaE
MKESIICSSPEETFAAGEKLGGDLCAGDVVLLTGGLGAGKTLFIKGVVNALEYDIDEVTSPSFTLVNLYRTELLDVYHIDLWRLESSSNPAEAVGLDEILENPRAITLIEWAERLEDLNVANNIIRVSICGDGDDPRHIDIEKALPPGKKI